MNGEEGVGRVMKYIKQIFVFFSIIIIFASIFVCILSQPIAYGVGKTGKIDEDMNVTRYYIIAINNSLVETTLYMLDNKYNVVLAPLTVALPSTCPVQNTLFPKGDNIEYIQNFTNANFNLPNGTHIGGIFYTIADYIGCGRDKTEIKRITLRYTGGPENIEGATIHVFVRVPHAEKYVVPLILYSRNIMFVYRYINSSYFELDVKLYYLTYELENIASKTYNVTIRFLINMNSWTAKYWNGFEWVPVGTLPLATPALDLSLMLYKLYQSYNANAKYYLEHKAEFQTIIDKIKSIIKNGDKEKVQQLIRQLASTPVPQIWKGYYALYLGKRIEIDMPAGAVVGPSINITFPAYTKIRAKVDTATASKFNDLIIKGLKEYILEGRTDTLDNVIVKNNGFVYYDSLYQKSRIGTELWTYMRSPLPAFGGNVLLALPAKYLSKCLGYDNKIEYALLSISTPTSIKSKGITIEKNKPLPKPPSLHSLGNNGYLVIAIDSRLAEKWMLTNIDAINPDARVSILYNLLSVVQTKYINTWYKIANGGDPKKEFQDFLSYLKSTVLATAYRLGGENGRELIENLIRNGLSTPETINNTTVPPSSSFFTSGNSVKKETPANGSSSGETNGGKNTGSRQYQIHAIVAILITIIIVLLVMFTRKR